MQNPTQNFTGCSAFKQSLCVEVWMFFRGKMQFFEGWKCFRNA